MASAARKPQSQKAAIISADGWHNDAAAAERLHCSTTWLGHRRAAGDGPAWFRHAGKIWYTRAALEEYIAKTQQAQGVVRCRSVNDAGANETRGRGVSTRGTSSSKSEGSHTAVERARQIAEQRLSKSVADALKSNRPVLLKLDGGQ
jgi:hypothetical protein